MEIYLFSTKAGCIIKLAHGMRPNEESSDDEDENALSTGITIRFLLHRNNTHLTTVLFYTFRENFITLKTCFTAKM